MSSSRRAPSRTSSKRRRRRDRWGAVGLLALAAAAGLVAAHLGSPQGWERPAPATQPQGGK